MPWADPEKNRAATARWKAAHPGYDRGRVRERPKAISRYAVLDEDVLQQRELYRLTRRKADHPDEYRKRERRWIQATDFWSGEDDGSGAYRRRAGQPDEA